MTTAEEPRWQDREQPTTQIIDLPADDSLRLAPNDGTHDEYAQWLKGYKQALLGELGMTPYITEEQLARRDIRPQLLADIISDIAQTREAYPTHRIAVMNHLNSLPAYRDALQADFFSERLEYRSGRSAVMDFVPPLHLTRIDNGHMHAARRGQLADTVARGIATGTLAPAVNVHIDYRDEGNSVFWWHGATWRHNDKYYGELLTETAAAKLGAEACRLLDHIDIKQPPDTGVRILDTINTAAGAQDPLALYRPLWQYTRSGATDAAAREEVEGMFARATDRAISLNDIELVPYATGFPVSLLQQVKEAIRTAGRVE